MPGSPVAIVLNTKHFEPIGSIPSITQNTLLLFILVQLAVSIVGDSMSALIIQLVYVKQCIEHLLFKTCYIQNILCQ